MYENFLKVFCILIFVEVNVLSSLLNVLLYTLHTFPACCTMLISKIGVLMQGQYQNAMQNANSTRKITNAKITQVWWFEWRTKCNVPCKFKLMVTARVMMQCTKGSNSRAMSIVELMLYRVSFLHSPAWPPLWGATEAALPSLHAVFAWYRIYAHY